MYMALEVQCICMYDPFVCILFAHGVYHTLASLIYIIPIFLNVSD